MNVQDIRWIQRYNNFNGEIWMDMITSRNLTSHTYNEEIAHKIASAIVQEYFVEFESLLAHLGKIKEAPE